jgi:hypothetical protein
LYYEKIPIAAATPSFECLSANTDNNVSMQQRIRGNTMVEIYKHILIILQAYADELKKIVLLKKIPIAAADPSFECLSANTDNNVSMQQRIR